MMDISRFDFKLPTDLIAQQPVSARSASRLLAVNLPDTPTVSDWQVCDLPRFVRDGDLVVMNDTRVVPARLFARKRTGGRVEIFLERILSSQRALCQLRANRSPKPGTQLQLDNGSVIVVGTRHGPFFELQADQDLLKLFEHHGSTPLPPYIERPADDVDRERYQTVFARRPGAVAAPTAGLHIDDDVLERIHAQGGTTAFLTLHVGAGTFSPVRDDDIDAHSLHFEQVEVPLELCDAIIETKARGGRIFAIGTTVVRALEAAALLADNAIVSPLVGETDLFIKPGFEFQVVDVLLTNFHLPKSTLLMLVCAFAGTDRVMSAYASAIERRYRFYSYGDAMVLERVTRA